MKQLRSFARYTVGFVAVVMLAFGIPGVHASPNNDPGVGQAGQHFFCIVITPKTGTFPVDQPCVDAGFRGIVGTFFDWTIKAPAGSSGGGGAGKLDVGHIVFRHPKSDASTYLLGALVKGEVLTDVKFSFIGVEAPPGSSYYTIDAKNAHVTSVNQYLPDTQANSAATTTVPLMEQVSIAFQALGENATGGKGRFQLQLGH